MCAGEGRESTRCRKPRIFVPFPGIRKKCIQECEKSRPRATVRVFAVSVNRIRDVRSFSRKENEDNEWQKIWIENGDCFGRKFWLFQLEILVIQLYSGKFLTIQIQLDILPIGKLLEIFTMQLENVSWQFSLASWHFPTGKCQLVIFTIQLENVDWKFSLSNWKILTEPEKQSGKFHKIQLENSDEWGKLWQYLRKILIKSLSRNIKNAYEINLD